MSPASCSIKPTSNTPPFAYDYKNSCRSILYCRLSVAFQHPCHGLTESLREEYLSVHFHTRRHHCQVERQRQSKRFRKIIANYRLIRYSEVISQSNDSFSIVS